MTNLTISISAVLFFLTGQVNAQSGFGTLVGVIRDPAKAPVAGATVTAMRDDGGAIRSTISGSDGVYSFSDLTPGKYAVRAKSDNRPDLVQPGLLVVAGEATRADMSVPANALPASNALSASNALLASNAVPPAPFPASTADAATQPATEPEESIWKRWTKGERIGWTDFTTRYPRVQRTAPVQTASVVPHPGMAPIAPTSAEASTVPQEPAAAPAAAAPPVDKMTPFADYDWTWLNGNSRQKDYPLDSKFFTGEFRADTFFGLDFNQPKDHSMGGSSEVFRNGEFQLEDLSVGGDFHAGNVRGRVLALFGMFSATTVRNDASPAVGQWDVRSAYKYVSEAYGGYHFNVQHGINVDAGIFVSYVGLFSYHNFDNWAYQPSYVSSNTPWFFNGLRVQWFPTQHLKIEPWLINGWQSYNKFNGHPGVGGQLKWTPNSWLEVVANQYGVGNDNIGLPHRGRYHTDDSVQVKYLDRAQAGNGIDRMAFSFTADAGCETGQGVTCHGGTGGPKQSFIGYMAYNRIWWHKDLFAFTLGGGQINNAGRYLTLVLPINGADAISGTPYFPISPGSSFKAYDGTATLDWMPSQFFTFRSEIGYRHSNVPYWSGRGGITPLGGNNGYPAQFVCNDGSPSVDGTTCGAAGLWHPDLRKGQALLNFSILVKL